MESQNGLILGSMVSYEYAPLTEDKEEIRLLTLLPGPFASEIRLDLEVARFTPDHVPKFEAVSYTWGSAENLIDIFVGKSGNKTLSVTKNLAEALPYFRFENRPRVLWIDAICVDQRNLKERGHQVKRMADIYTKAAKVLVWLGPESQDSLLALFCIKYIASKVEVDWETGQLSATTDELHWVDLSLDLPFGEEVWMAMHHLMQRPWFERLWIRREVLLASSIPRVICGKWVILWSELCTAVACFWQKLTHFEDFASFRTRLRLIWQLCDNRRRSTYDLINSSQRCVCADPRDRIYALLSLLPEAVRAEIEPDYTKSVHEVYIDAALSFIQAGAMDNLGILTLVESHKQDQKLPSWVPDVCIISAFTHLGLAEYEVGCTIQTTLVNGQCLRLHVSLVKVLAFRTFIKS